jgi:hypothetical protein
MAGKRTTGGAAVADPPADDTTQTPSDGETGDDGSENEPKGRGGAIAERTLNIPGVPVKFTTVAAIVPANISFSNWERTWAAVGGVRESSKWWQGDLLLVGEAKYKEKYSQALDQTSSEYGTLRNIAYVAGKFSPERRRPELTWSHHQAAAGVPAEVADNILGQAAEGDWGVAQVRMAVREWKEEQDNAKDAPAPPSSNGTAAVAPSPSKPTGLQPDPNGEWECPNCPGMMFAAAMWHCLECGAHNPDVKDGVQVEECLYCPEPGTVAATTPPADTATTDGEGEDDGETETPGTVSGTVIPADANFSIEDVSDLLAFSGIRALPVKDVAEYVKGMGADGLGACMALHEYLGRLIEAVASKAPREKKAPNRPKYAGPKPDALDTLARQTGGTVENGTATEPAATKPLSPAPKPAGKARKAKAAAAPVAVAEPEEAGLEDAGDDLPFE